MFRIYFFFIVVETIHFWLGTLWSTYAVLLVFSRNFSMPKIRDKRECIRSWPDMHGSSPVHDAVLIWYGKERINLRPQVATFGNRCTFFVLHCQHHRTTSSSLGHFLSHPEHPFPSSRVTIIIVKADQKREVELSMCTGGRKEGRNPFQDKRVPGFFSDHLCVWLWRKRICLSIQETLLNEKCNDDLGQWLPSITVDPEGIEWQKLDQR